MRTKRIWLKRLPLYLCLTLAGLVFIFPLYMLFAKSLMTRADASYYPPYLWANEGITLNGYKSFFELAGRTSGGVSYMLVYLLNTLQTVLFSTAGVLFSSTLVAYGLTKIRFPGRNAIFTVILSTLMIPAAVTMIPLYIIFSKLHWTDSILPLWVPLCFGGGAVNIFLVRQFMLSLPKELNESAAIDGAGHFRQYFSIILPNCIPIMIVVGIGCVTGAWNDLQGPLTYISSHENYTLTLAVAMIGTGQSGMNENIPGTMAACMILLLPPLLLFIFGQKFFIENVIMSGVKG